ncbi:MAG: tyrosine-type recombinase/integrase, partial [Candidatus Binatia bacterium]
VDLYLNAIKPQVRPVTFAQYHRYLRRFRFSGNLDAIQPPQITDHLTNIDGLNARSAAYTSLKIFLGWCVQQDYLRTMPMAKLKKPRVPEPEERLLSDEELKAIWAAVEKHSDQRYAAIIKLCMITGQRKGQFASLQERWVDQNTKTISWPGSIMKNKLPHTIGYGDLTTRVIEKLRATDGHYFSPLTNPGRPFTAWGKCKARLDALCPLPPWHVHSLRTTWSTNAARLGIEPHVAELVLSHKAPLGAMAARYNRWKYEPEKRAAIIAMERHICAAAIGK